MSNAARMRAKGLSSQIAASTLAAALLWSAGVAAQEVKSDAIARGEYLVHVGDCASCHTVINGKPFAGGRAIATPFGLIFSTNLTPDPATGIGAWSEQDFYTAMHDGVRRDGSHLYPAFPYPWFTKASRADIDAIKTYLNTLAPVVQANKPTELPWPLSWRGGAMFGWNTLFFDKGDYTPDGSRSAQWNRGAYLVQGLAHCGACHTPRDWMGASKRDQAFEGGSAGLHWFAPALGGDIRDGVGGWSAAQIVEYLKTGANSKSATVGPMSEVVMNSTQYLSDTDLQAIALYLKEPAQNHSKSPPETTELGAAALARGEALYIDNCTACHLPDGRGIANVFPPLTGSSAIQADDAGTVVHVVLEGSRMAASASKPTALAMPGFGWKLEDQELADVVNYIRHAWGNSAPLVDAKTVAAVRKDVKPNDSPSRDKTYVRADLALEHEYP